MRHLKSISVFFFAAAFPSISFAAGENVTESKWANPMLWFLIMVIILLAFAISALAGTIKNISNSEKNKEKEQNNNSKKIVSIGILFLIPTFMLNAAEPVFDGAKSVMGIPFSDFYLLMAIIVIEIIIIFVLLGVLKIRYEPLVEVKAHPANVKKEKSILEVINDSVEIEKEEEIMMDHEYDGIRELDNSLPPWWKYGFYLTIIVAIFYLIHYHVTETGDLQVAELEKNIKTENEKIAAYLKQSSNNVDEMSVKYLDNPQDLQAGKDIFTNLCVACHGKAGEGTVGPNLTDDYWIHGGSISEIFKSVKYGWTDKGMRSWKDELSPIKMAQVSSFIKSLKGSNPPNAKAKEGELFIEEGDSKPTEVSSIEKDSTSKIAKDTTATK